MKIKRFLCAVISFAIVFSIGSIKIESAVEEYGFTERIVYGGTAMDFGDYIYYANFEDDMKLYRKLMNAKQGELIYDFPVGYINSYNENIYFISNNSIIKIDPNGDNPVVLYESDKKITHLYVTHDCMYFLSVDTVIMYKNGRPTSIFSQPDIGAFMPVTEYEFLCYKNNPLYIENNRSYETKSYLQEKFLTYTYNTNTKHNSSIKPNTYNTAVELQSMYSGPFVEVGATTLPLEELMPGSFFSKNGKACTCHNDPNIDCISSVGGCNCMRYWPTGSILDYEIDLLGAQCFAFARLVFYKCFGFIDHPSYSGDYYYSVGSISPGAVTAGSAKELLMKAKTGAHVRLTRGHSISILKMDQESIVIYHGNAGGDGVASKPCVVSTRHFTWQEFAAFAAAGISYVNMPYDYPGVQDQDKKKEGIYRTNYNLNVRVATGTSYKSMGVLPNNSEVLVIQVSNGWGRIEYNGSTDRWISLDYAEIVSELLLTPTKDSPVIIDGDYLLGIDEGTKLADIIEYFPDQELKAIDKNANPLVENGFLGTGSIVYLELNGNIFDNKEVLINGDIDGNGIVEAVDYLILKRIYLGNYECDEVYLLAADMNNDNFINAIDYLLVKKHIIKSNIWK